MYLLKKNCQLKDSFAKAISLKILKNFHVAYTFSVINDEDKNLFITFINILSLL